MDTEHPTEKPPESEGRLRILKAAYPLFVEHGYKAVSMQQIADAAHIHKATLYHHFLHKEALFTAVVQVELEQLQGELIRAIEQRATVADRLVSAAWQFFSRSHADFGRLMTDVRENLPDDVRQRLQMEQSFPWGQLESIFEDATRSGELPAVDRELAASMFTGLIWGQIWMRKMERTAAPLTEDLARTLVDILLAGLRTSTAAASGEMTASGSPVLADSHR